MTRPLDRRLLEEQRANKRAIVRQLVGSVVNDSPFTVRVRGVERENLVYLSGYAPAVGDRVLLTQRGHEAPIVHGKLGSATQPSPSWNNIGSIEVFGHSGVYGGATNNQRGTDQRLGALLGADAYNRSRGGARISWHEGAVQMGGGWAHVYRHIDPGNHGKPYISNRDVVVLWFGENDLATLGPTQGDFQPALNALEAAISRARAAAVFEETSTGYVTFPSGSWSTVGNAFAGYPSGNGNLLIASGGGYKSAASGTVQCNVPEDFFGGTVALAFLSGSAGEGAAITFTVDGVPAGSLETRDMNAHDYGTSNVSGTNRNVTPVVKRFTGLAGGEHTIVATVGSVNTACLFDGWWIEAPAPPLVVVPGAWNTSNAQPNFNFYDIAGFPYIPNTNSVAGMNAMVETVCAGFGDDVIFVDVDPILNRSPINFAPDHIHPSDNGHSLIAAEIALRVQSRARTRVAHSQGSGASGFVAMNPVANRNVIEAQQSDAIPLTLKGRLPGDQFVSLLRLDGSGSYSLAEFARNFDDGSDARLGVVDTAGLIVDDTEIGDMVVRADNGRIVLGAADTAGLIITATGAETPGVLRATNGTNYVDLGLVGGLPYIGFSGDATIYRSAANEMTVGSGDKLKSDDPTAAQHVATKAYVDARTSAYTRWMPDHAGSIAINTVTTANMAYFAEVFVGPTVATGVEFRPVNTTGNVKAILYNGTTGAIVAKTTATVAVAGSGLGVKQQVAFSAPAIINAGVYCIGLAFSSTATITSNQITKRGGSVASSYTTPVDPITVPTDIGGSLPYMHLY